MVDTIYIITTATTVVIANDDYNRFCSYLYVIATTVVIPNAKFYVTNPQKIRLSTFNILMDVLLLIWHS